MVARPKKQASCLAIPSSLPRAVMVLAMATEEVVRMVLAPIQMKTVA